MFEDADLRKLLISYRETVIYAEQPDTPLVRKHCVLRRRMIDHLIASRPKSASEWRLGLPDRLRQETDAEQMKTYGGKVITIVLRLALFAIPQSDF